MKIGLGLAIPPCAYLLSLFHFYSDTPFHLFQFFSDDFFYYLEIAEHVVAGDGATFDGATRTNGYHPLWMAVLIGAAQLIPVRSPGFVIFVVATASLACGIGTMGIRRLLCRLMGPNAFILPATVMYYFAALRLSLTGMEIILVFALAPFLVLTFLDYAEKPSVSRAARFGLISSLLILGRLDALLYVVMFVGAAIWLNRRAVISSGFVTHAIGFSLAGMLLPTYLLYNLNQYGHLLPVSGVAKGLRTEHTISTTALSGFVESTSVLWFLVPAGVGIANLLGLFLLLRRWRRPRTPSDAAVLLLLGIPVLYYLVTAIRSDWPLWPWYYYPLVLALPVSVVVIGNRLATRWPFLGTCAQRFRVPAAAGVLLVLTAYLIMWPFSRPARAHPTLGLGLVLSEFARDHPGRYAMGDRAGMVAFLLEDPLVQTEGLVADFAMVDAIREGRSLEEVLRAYEADYYIALSPLVTNEGCWHLEEPRQPGPSAPRMRLDTCQTPIARLLAPEVTVMVFRVADLEPVTSQVDS